MVNESVLGESEKYEKEANAKRKKQQQMQESKKRVRRLSKMAYSKKKIDCNYLGTK